MQQTDITSPAGQMKASKNGLAADIYGSIKKKILDVESEPGTRLIIDKLARELGVSSSPVRESLSRLLAERLVVFRPNSGYVVADLPDKQYFADLIEYRVLVECEAVKIGAPRRDHAILKRLHEAMWEMDRLPLGRTYEEFQEFSSWDAKFHLTLIESTGNQVMVQSYSDLQSHLHLSRLYRHQLKQVDKEDVLRDHMEIIKAFDEGDGEAAARTVRKHVEHTRKMLQYEVPVGKKVIPETTAAVDNATRYDAAEDGKVSHQKRNA